MHRSAMVERFSLGIEDEYVVPIVEQKSQPKKSKSGVIIDGMDDVDIKFAKCCTPLPGDEIIAFITKGHGISVHKCDCRNVPENIDECETPDRWIKARWSEAIDSSFITVIEIHSYDRTGLVADLAGQLGNMRINIHNMSSKIVPGNIAVVTFNITVRDKSHLRDIISRLMAVRGVISVERTKG